jgi:hypothetical protein
MAVFVIDGDLGSSELARQLSLSAGMTDSAGCRRNFVELGQDDCCH